MTALAPRPPETEVAHLDRPQRLARISHQGKEFRPCLPG